VVVGSIVAINVATSVSFSITQVTRGGGMPPLEARRREESRDYATGLEIASRKAIQTNLSGVRWIG
jgi:hypothetical protein